MTNLSLLEFFQRQGSFYFGSQPNRLRLLRKMNVKLQILTVFFLFLWAQELKGHIGSKLELQIKLRGRRTKTRKKERKANNQKRWQRETERSCTILARVVLLSDFLSASSSKYFLIFYAWFKYFKICATWNDSHLGTINRFKQISNSVWNGDDRGTYYLTTQAPELEIFEFWGDRASARRGWASSPPRQDGTHFWQYKVFLLKQGSFKLKVTNILI